MFNRINDSLFYSDTNIYYNDKEILFKHSDLLKPNSFNLTSVKDENNNTYYELWFADENKQLTQLTYNIKEENGLSLDEDKRWKINMDNITIQENSSYQLHINNDYIIKAYGTQTKGVIKLKNENPHLNMYEPNNNIGTIIINDNGQLSISPTILGLISQLEESKEKINNLIEEIDKLLKVYSYDENDILMVGEIIYYNPMVGFSKYNVRIKDDLSWKPYYVCVISSGILPDGKARIMNIYQKKEIQNLDRNLISNITDANQYDNIPLFRGDYQYNTEDNTYNITNTNIKGGLFGYIATDTLNWMKYYNPFNNKEHYGVKIEESPEVNNNINIIGAYINNGKKSNYSSSMDIISNHFRTIEQKGINLYIADDFSHVFTNNQTITIPKIKVKIEWDYPDLKSNYTQNGTLPLQSLNIGYIVIDYNNVTLKFLESNNLGKNISIPYGQTDICHTPIYGILYNENEIQYSTYTISLKNDLNGSYNTYLYDRLNNSQTSNMLDYPLWSNIHNTDNMLVNEYYNDYMNREAYNFVKSIVNNLYDNNLLYGSNIYNKFNSKKLSLNKSSNITFGGGEISSRQYRTTIYFEIHISGNNYYSEQELAQCVTCLNSKWYTVSGTTNGVHIKIIFNSNTITDQYYYSGDSFKNTQITTNDAPTKNNIINLTTISGGSVSWGNLEYDNSAPSQDTEMYECYSITCSINASMNIGVIPNFDEDIQRTFLKIENKDIITCDINNIFDNFTFSKIPLSLRGYYQNYTRPSLHWEIEDTSTNDDKAFNLYNVELFISDSNGNFNNPYSFINLPNDVYCSTYFKYSYNDNKTFEFPTKYTAKCINTIREDYDGSSSQNTTYIWSFYNMIDNNHLSSRASNQNVIRMTTNDMFSYILYNEAYGDIEQLYPIGSELQYKGIRNIFTNIFSLVEFYTMGGEAFPNNTLEIDHDFMLTYEILPEEMKSTYIGLMNSADSVFQNELSFPGSLSWPHMSYNNITNLFNYDDNENGYKISNISHLFNKDITDFRGDTLIVPEYYTNFKLELNKTIYFTKNNITVTIKTDEINKDLSKTRIASRINYTNGNLQASQNINDSTEQKNNINYIYINPTYLGITESTQPYAYISLNYYET